MAKSTPVIIAVGVIVTVLVVITVVAVVTPLAILLGGGDDTPSESDVFKLHVNPADPVIMSVETLEGDTIFMLGNKTSDGLPQSVDEFRIENEEDTTYISLDSEGSIMSAINTDGLQLNFIWGENFTTLHSSIVIGNGSEQLSINIDLSEPMDDNFPDFTDLEESENNFVRKRSVHDEQRIKQTKSSRIQRQSDSQNFAGVTVSVESCNQPEQNARVFADVLLNYEEDTDNYGSSASYIGVKTSVPGQYLVRIPTSAASDVGDKAAMICDQIEMILGKVCDTYSQINDFVSLFSKHEADSLICFAIGNGLKLAFPYLRVVPVYHFCKTAFRGFELYCDYANKDLGDGLTPENILCDALPLVDNGVDLIQQESILLTPSAVFPQGNSVTAQGRALTLPPGLSAITEGFTIENNQDTLRIASLDVIPFDPAPGENYTVSVSFECYSGNLNVFMSINGTDSYYDERRCFGDSTCVLFVPGAEALVQDSVTVMAQDRPTTLERRVIVIF